VTTDVCSLCGKRRDQVERLVHNGSVFMCNECGDDLAKKYSAVLGDWIRITVRGVEFDWCAHRNVLVHAPGNLEQVVIIQVHRVGERDGVRKVFPPDTIPTESHAIETIEEFADRFGLEKKCPQ